MVTITLLVMRRKLINGGPNCARYILVRSEQIILQFHCMEQMSPSRLYNITTRLQVAQLSITIKVCAVLVHSSILLLINLPGGWRGRGVSIKMSVTLLKDDGICENVVWWYAQCKLISLYWTYTAIQARSIIQWHLNRWLLHRVKSVLFDEHILIN